MKNLLLNVFDKFLNTDFYSRLHNLFFGDLEWRIYRLTEHALQTAKLHERTFPPFKCKHSGKDIVVVACGPSAADYKPIPGAIHIGVNRAYKYNQIKFNYLFANDGGPACRDMIDDICEYPGENCQKFFGIQTPHIADSGRFISDQDAARANALRYHLDNFCQFRGFKSELAYDLSTQAIGTFGSTVFAAIQFALWTNPKRLFLVGCDCTAVGHFYKKDEKTFLDIRDLLRGYSELKKFAESHYPYAEIISINPVGLKGLFKDWYQNDSPTAP